MNYPVFDLHCDTAFEMLNPKLDGMCSLRKNNLHIDLERASQLPGYAQCFACFTTVSDYLPFSVSAETLFTREMTAIVDAVNANCQLIKQAKTPQQIEENFKQGIMSAILTLEGPAGISYDPSMLKSLYEMGFRITTLGWNEQNPLTGSHATGGGLTDRGRAYVMEAQRLGLLVDVSHISDEAFWDIMSITKAPIIASHSNSRAVWNVSRNLTDEMFVAICKSEGVVGINLYSDFLGADPDLNTVCDHILHFLRLDSTGKHIALGGDLDGCEKLPKDFNGIQDYPKLAERLLSRGVCENTVYDIFWNNAMGVMKRCCM